MHIYESLKLMHVALKILTSWVFKNNSTAIRISFNKAEQVEKFTNNKQYKMTEDMHVPGEQSDSCCVLLRVLHLVPSSLLI